MNTLKVERLSQAYGSIRAVDSVSFEVRAGEIYGLLGPNGAGKTTTISMISGLLKPDSGDVLVAGSPFSANPQAAKRIMGVVPQELAVYEEMNGRENLEFWGRMAGLSRAEAKTRASELLEALALADRSKDLVKTYSGGMKRRINLGCALLHRPKLLLLDEPTVGIDPQARLSILEFIRRLRNDGTAVLYTTHYLEEAETLCQRIGIIDQGRLLAEGTLPELQDRLGGDRVFVLEADLDGTGPEHWNGFEERFRVIQKNERQLVVAARGARDPSECLKDLLGLPVRAENVTLKRPTLTMSSFNSRGAIFANKMLHVLLAKDLRRAWRNPLPWLVNLIIPVAITALIGLAFGGRPSEQALGKVRFAIVDEDQSLLSEFLRGAMQNREASEHFEPVFMTRSNAVRVINQNSLSAVVIIPTNFMKRYLSGESPLSLELIKNPAESVHPAVIEEMLGIGVAALNAISRNLNSEFPEWRRALDGKMDFRHVSQLVERAGEKLEKAGKFIDPPLVSYAKEEDALRVDGTQNGAETNAVASAGKPKEKTRRNDAANIFGFLLIGMAGMFLLFQGSTAMVDLHREVRQRTFARYQTLNKQYWPFIAGKVSFALAVLLICSGVMFLGGGWAFGIHWRQPSALFALVVAYSAFTAALFALLTALIPDERSAGALNTVVGMVLAIAGGCAFPLQQMPAFLRDHISPLLPTHWFVQAARGLQFNDPVPLGVVVLKLAITGAVLIAAAAFVFRRQFSRGGQ